MRSQAEKDQAYEAHWTRLMGDKGQGGKRVVGTVKDVEALEQLWRTHLGRRVATFERTAGWWNRSSDLAKETLWDTTLRLIEPERSQMGTHVLDEMVTLRHSPGHLVHLLYSRDGKARNPEASLASWRILREWMDQGGKAKQIPMADVLETMVWHGSWEWARHGHAALLEAVLSEATARGLTKPIEKATTDWVNAVFSDAPARGLEDALDVLLRAGADFRARTFDGGWHGKTKISPLERLAQPLREHYPNLHSGRTGKRQSMPCWTGAWTGRA